MFTRTIIASRHEGAVKLIKCNPKFKHAAVLPAATKSEVCGAIVAGNLPLELAAYCQEYYQLIIPHVRGEYKTGELTLNDLRLSGAYLVGYKIEPLPIDIYDLLPAFWAEKEVKANYSVYSRDHILLAQFSTMPAASTWLLSSLDGALLVGWNAAADPVVIYDPENGYDHRRDAGDFNWLGENLDPTSGIVLDLTREEDY